MPAWLLRTLAVAVSGFSMFGSTQYVLSHPRNPAAPLLPPVVDPVEEEDVMPSEVMVMTARPTAPPRATVGATAAPATSAAAAAIAATAPVAVVVTLPPSTAIRTQAPAARATPAPTLRIVAGVRPTQLPRVTTTHTS